VGKPYSPWGVSTRLVPGTTPPWTFTVTPVAALAGLYARRNRDKTEVVIHSFFVEFIFCLLLKPDL